MPRSGPQGTATPPPGTFPKNPGDTIPSAAWNQLFSDLYGIANTPVPIAYGGTGQADLILPTNLFGIKDNADPTKIAKFDAAAIPTATIRTYAFPATSGTFALTSDIITPPPPKGYLYGLTLSNNGADITNDIDIAAGDAASDASTPTLLTLAASLTKRLDAAWTVGSGSGGLDTGSIGNNTYHVWIIQRSDTLVVDALFSVSATAPTMPTNYDRKRRIGSFVRSSGSIRRFSQMGDEFLYFAPLEDVSVTTLVAAPGTAFTLGSIPTGIRVTALITAEMSNSSANRNGLITSLDQSDDAPSDRGQIWMPVPNQLSAAALRIRTNTSGQIRARSDLDNTTLRITTTGFVDTRGRV